MKILHFGIGRSLGSGVKKQLSTEFSISSYINDCEWTTLFSSHDSPTTPFMINVLPKWVSNSKSRVLRYFALRFFSYHWLSKHSSSFDLILLRYPLGDPILPLFICKIGTFLTVHHTKELDEIKSTSSLLGIIHQTIERFSSRIILSQSSGFVCMTREIAKYEVKRSGGNTKPVYIWPNGIDTRHPKNLIDKRSGRVKLLILLSKNYPWHGMDLILKQFKLHNGSDIELHIVGDFFNITPNSNIICHGQKSSNEIELLSQKMDIGLGSFALFRKGMTEACTLKTREYLLNGLPVYADHSDSALPNSFNYYIHAEFNVRRAIKEALIFRHTRKDKIRRSAIPYIDKLTLTQRLYAQLSTDIQL